MSNIAHYCSILSSIVHVTSYFSLTLSELWYCKEHSDIYQYRQLPILSGIDKYCVVLTNIHYLSLAIYLSLALCYLLSDIFYLKLAKHLFPYFTWKLNPNIIFFFTKFWQQIFDPYQIGTNVLNNNTKRNCTQSKAAHWTSCTSGHGHESRSIRRYKLS